MTKHIHQYYQLKIGRGSFRRNIVRCAIPKCTHKLNEPELAIGRESLCNRCETPFIITKEHLRIMKMHCDSCTKSPKMDEVNKLAELLK